MATRVFELARQLGVTSKDVLSKCRAEGLDVKNHMSSLSAGLDATIREWFSEAAASSTAVETTEHVDLAAARKKASAQRRRRKKAEAEAAAETAVVAPAPAEGEAPTPVEGETVVVAAEAPAAEEAPTDVEELADALAAAIAEEPTEADGAEAVEQPAEQVVPPEPEAEPLKAVPNVPERPEVLGPAGPQVVPKPAKLMGPQVVRFEGLEVEIGSGRSGPPPAARAPVATDDSGKKGEPGAGEDGKGKKGSRRRSPRRRGGRVAERRDGTREWRDRDLAERSERLAAATGGTLRRHRASVGAGGVDRGAVISTGEVEVEEPLTIKNLSAATGVKVNEIIRKLLSLGVMATVNQRIDQETAEAVAIDYGIELTVKAAVTAESQLEEELAARSSGASGELVPRAPVATFLGHVDHGKTSLLDRIRNATVADGEEGGITQHIGAHRYDLGDTHVVFLDTPGHEAFTAMRARGANMTDVVVLVVAADDGVMPQTVEAIAHAKAAGVPIIVALNKIDLPNANVQRALGQLAEHELHPREWGGDTEVIHTSAETGEGVETLVETLGLEAELLELKADPDAPAGGFVVEAQRDPNRGVLATLLVRDGTLRVGDVVICGHAYGRIRSMRDDRGTLIEEAPPATPVEVSGLDDVPGAGDKFHVTDDITKVQAVAEERRRRQREKDLAAAPQASLEDIFGRIEAGALSELQLIVKADVQGSIEALLGSIEKIGHEEVRVRVLHSAVGGITEGDVILAEASQAIILGFRVVADTRARALAEQKNVDVRTYRVIYKLIEELEQAVTGMLAPEMVEKVSGRAEVREVFKVSRIGSIAGCFVTDGVINRNSKVRIVRDNVIIEDERGLDSLKRFKDDAREVRNGLECGLKISGFNDIKVGDVLEAYEIIEVARKA